jgi:RimJ/RimL family protein N-acetyltransferase
VELTDGVVRLRPLRAEDAPAVYETCVDPETQRFTISLPDPYRLEDAEGFIEYTHRAAADGTEITFGIVQLPADEWLGTMSVRLGERPSIGYMVSPHARGRGLATRALVLLSRWALAEHGIERLELTTHPENVASQRVAEKAGFVREGVLRSYMRSRRDGVLRDSVVFSLLPRDVV